MSGLAGYWEAALWERSKADWNEEKLRSATAEKALKDLNNPSGSQDQGDPFADAQRTADLRQSEADREANRNYDFRRREKTDDHKFWSSRQAAMEAMANREYNKQQGAAQSAFQNRDRMTA